MEIGIIGKLEIIVTEEKTAKAMGSGELNVFATPAMIAMMENTAYTSIADQLEPGQGTVGTLMNVKHVAATPVGMKVVCETKLIEIDRRRLVFAVTASDEAGLIGEGVHERFIVDNAKFQSRADAKLEDR
ncbi:MAG: thioesterase family protein [Clostridia bacterium]|nr:thioesterase family protein [Clostridia bacterium]